MASAAGTHTDSSGRLYVTTLSREEYDRERAKADLVHVVAPERTRHGDD